MISPLDEQPDEGFLGSICELLRGQKGVLAAFLAQVTDTDSEKTSVILALLPEEGRRLKLEEICTSLSGILAGGLAEDESHEIVALTDKELASQVISAVDPFFVRSNACFLEFVDSLED